MIQTKSESQKHGRENVDLVHNWPIRTSQVSKWWQKASKTKKAWASNVHSQPLAHFFQVHYHPSILCININIYFLQPVLKKQKVGATLPLASAPASANFDQNVSPILLGCDYLLNI